MKNKNKVIIFIAILVILFIIVYELKFNKNNNISQVSNNQNVEFSVEFESSSQADFYSYNNNIYYCTKDGLNLVDNSGKIIGIDTYNMNNPILFYNRNIVGVFEKNGKAVRIYNENGKLYTIESSDPIINVSVNKNGFSSVIIKQNEDYSLNVYNSNGDIISETSHVFKDGIPFACDISNDNSMLAVSYLDITDIKIKSTVIFYSIDSNLTDGFINDYILAAFNEDENIIAVLKFMDNNHLITVSDKNITCTYVKLEPSGNVKHNEVWKKSLTNELEHISFIDDKTIALAFGEAFINTEDSLMPNTAIWLNVDGTLINEITMDKEITSLTSNNSVTIVKSDRLVQAYDNKGNKLWEHHTTQDVNKVLPYSKSNKAIFVLDRVAEVISIVK